MIKILEFRKPREERTPQTTKQQSMVQNLQIETTHGSEPTNPKIIKNKKAWTWQIKSETKSGNSITLRQKLPQNHM